jgi:hypothetical protein
MLAYRLEVADELITQSSKNYRIKQLDELKELLIKTKSQLDDLYKNPQFNKQWRECDPFKNEKALVAKLGNTYNVSNAWLKCYEILIYFKILPNDLSKLEYPSDNFVHFDNAAFPGSFIISTHHLVKTQYSWHLKYKWYGSSLLDANKQNANPLEDKYKLYSNYKKNWLMNENNNGDVLSSRNQLDFYKQLGNKVDLYTSDLGFDVSSDYNNQELLQAPANIGQILTGLLTLRIGGCFITKQYTIFEPLTISVMYLVASFFDEFYICKPYSSREANSETYLIGKGFKQVVDISHPYIKALFNKIENFNTVPIFDAKDYPKQYIKTIITASKEIFGKQIAKINEDIKRINGKVDLKDLSESMLVKWYSTYKILPITKDKRLIMNNLYNQ